mgnify:CR=1 FL=1
MADNVTILGLASMTATMVAGDLFVVWDTSASGTLSVTASQMANVVFAQTATIVTLASGGTVQSVGNYTLGAGTALATNATVGHIMIPSCAGVPTASVIGATGGNIPMVVDTTNYRLYFLLPSGVWRQAALA